MNEITLTTAELPVICGCDFCAAYEPFVHADRTVDFNVLIYVTEGCISVTEGGEEYHINAGELLFLKSGVRHFGESVCPKGTRWYYVHFKLTGEGRFPQYSAGEPLHQYEPAEGARMLPKKLTGLAGSTAEREISRLIEYFHSADRMKKWNINARLFSVLTELAFFEEQRSPVLTLADRIADMLAEHCCEPFSAKLTERHFFLSYKHMAAVFRKERGCTMQQYHNSLRMEHAAKLLRSTLLSVGEISEQCGFADMLYFSRCFRRYHGASPTDYRKTAPKT